MGEIGDQPVKKSGIPLGNEKPKDLDLVFDVTIVVNCSFEIISDLPPKKLQK
jgi:hypothetical protein